MIDPWKVAVLGLIARAASAICEASGLSVLVMLALGIAGDAKAADIGAHLCIVSCSALLVAAECTGRRRRIIERVIEGERQP